MIEFNNTQDQNIWSSLEDFDFTAHPNISKLRIELYLSIIKSIGMCGTCVSFNKETNFCKVLQTKMGTYERCSDFIPIIPETESAFDVMSEEFRRDQENLTNFAKIRKYQRRPNIIRPEDKNVKNPKRKS